MTNPKGTAAESAVVNYLRENGFPYAERRQRHGSKDFGDITVGDPAVVIEVKAERTMRLAVYVDETETEADNVEREFGNTVELAVAWHKRRGKGSPGQWYVTMTGARFLEILRRHCDLPV